MDLLRAQNSIKNANWIRGNVDEYREILIRN